MEKDSQNTKIRVFIVEDEQAIRRSFKMDIAQHTRTICVGEAETIEKAISALQKIHDTFCNDQYKLSQNFPDVMLVDMNFRNPTTLRMETRGHILVAGIKKLREKFPDFPVKILCVSNNLEPEVIIEALRNGADGYIDKNLTVDGWIEAIILVFDSDDQCIVTKNVLERISFLSPETQYTSSKIYEPPQIEGLSEHATKIAELFWRFGLQAHEIAEKLGIAEATVRYHLDRIRSTDYLVTVFGFNKSRKHSRDDKNG